MKNNDYKLISGFLHGTFSVLKALLTVFNQAFKPRVTLLYPETKPEIPEKFRGKIELDYEKCTGCGLCAKLCPALSVLTVKDTNKDGKKLVNIDISRCIFCGNCAENCPKQAINITKQYELATNNKKDLILKYDD